MNTIIEIKNVYKYYRMGEERIAALHDVSVKFERGKIYCLVGTSGSGKSTLLNLMAGLEKPTKGSIEFIHYRKQTDGSETFENIHIEKMNETQLARFRQKYIGFVFQSYNLMPTLTALENVTLPLIFRKAPGKTRNRQAYEMLKAVGLADRYKHKPSQMSGGQQQRVSIARAFVNNPKIIFADEPTGNLDTKTTFEMMDLMADKARENNTTLIIVTHDLELSRYADEIVYIRDGLIEKIENMNTNKSEGFK